jgi:ABC-type sugar transport system ATPase subunit
MQRLTLQGVTRTYGQTRALDAAALDLTGGEVHALMGENGAGKSTLIRILAGLERPDAGTIALNGVPLPLTGPQDAAAAGLRFLHQELHVVPGLSVAENMHLARPYPSRFGLVRWDHLAAAAQAALHRLGVTHIDPRAEIGAYGPGDQMLARIAATLIEAPGPPPWAYVMDEPTAALTGAEAERLFAAIGALRGAGSAVLYVSHRMDEVLRLADRVTVLRDGRPVSTRPIAETTRDQIIRDMTGREISNPSPPVGDRVRAMPVLQVQNLSAGSVQKVSFAVGAGEILGVAGLSGSGRNMLLRALIGAVPRQGAVLLNGMAMGATPAESWAAGLAYVPRERRTEGLMLLRPLSETIALPHLSALSRLALVSRSRIADLVARFAREVRLKAQGGHQVTAELSGGNQQKVLFARALAGSPKVMLLDEPTRGVDVGAKFDIYATIRARAAQGAAVVIVSSDLPELIGLSDRIAILSAGRLARIVPASGLTEAALLAHCYDSEVA